MKNESNALLIEIRDMLKLLADGQEQLVREISKLRDEQKKLEDEIKLNNFVLHSMGSRSEITN